MPYLIEDLIQQLLIQDLSVVLGGPLRYSMNNSRSNKWLIEGLFSKSFFLFTSIFSLINTCGFADHLSLTSVLSRFTRYDFASKLAYHNVSIYFFRCALKTANLAATCSL